MNHAQACKYVVVTPPGAKLDDASATTAEIDTAGFDYCEIDVILGDSDIAMAALAVTESDTTGSNHTNVTGLVYGTSADISGSTSALPSATDDNKVFKFEIDLRGRKRFLDVTATAGNGSTGTYLAIIARLYRCDEIPITAAARGLGNVLRV